MKGVITNLVVIDTKLVKSIKMAIGNNLMLARKKSGLSQEEVANKLGVSRQTISNWELDETIPDIYQTKKLAILFKISIDDLIDVSFEEKEIENTINSISEKQQEKINWTKVWSKKYPILAKYQEEVEINYYAQSLNALIRDLEIKYSYNRLDAMLVLKDILGHTWNKNV